VLNFAQFVTILLLAAWAGSASDRVNRRQLLLVSQSAAIVLSAGSACWRTTTSLRRAW